MEKRSDELMPNDVTYNILFRATNLLSHPRLARRLRRPENAVPPRSLFREMLAGHLEQTKGRPLGRSTVISVSAFHLALRTFMARSDYAAAFITYLIVFVNLLNRMKHEADLSRPEGSYHRIQQRRPAFERSGSSSIGIETVSHLLSLGEHAGPTDDDLSNLPIPPPFPSQVDLRRRHAQVPTVAMLTGSENISSHQRVFFSPVPLARIIHKALLECAKATYSDISLLMPSSFAEVWLKIYTKDGTFHGLIQAQEEEEGFDPSVLGGPAVAATAVVVGGDLDLQPIKVWQPGSPGLGDRPSTPRTFSRNVSTMSVMSASGLGSTGGGVGRRASQTVGRTPSFSENQFTAVPPNFRGESPSRKPRSKRGRDVSDSVESERPRKSLRKMRMPRLSP
ncbi:hypothetical protein J3R83DRAFT_367 [Lanmaoa asiatica]|nr:hypothetical protein J3R83DRAFT_367 [Lanmaoa asiatica]